MKLLNRVRSLLERGERISVEDGIELFSVRDLLALGKLARIPRERRFGNRAFLRHAWAVNYNGEHPEFFIEAATTEAPEGVEEIVVRALDPNGAALAEWSERVKAFGRSSVPAVLQVGAGFVDRLAAFEKLSATEVLEALRIAGPIALNGMDAELFDPATRATITRPTIDAARWLEIHESAHAIGMKSSASMVYLVEDQPSAYAAHLESIRSLQDRSNGFPTFAPLAVHYQGVRNHLAMPTAAQSLRMIAISRIMLDNIPHIASVPTLVTSEVAVVALGYGADTVDTTIAPGDIALGEMPLLPGNELKVIDAAGQGASGTVGEDFRRVEERIVEARFAVESGVASRESRVNE